jgi:hypothetical protein
MSVLLTDDVTEFVDSLNKGDVLLMDTLHYTSQLIQLALNRPVNHSAIFVGKNKYADANERPKGQPTVCANDIRGLLRSRNIRTVTALRHKEVVAGHVDTTSVIEQVNTFINEKDTTFAYMSLAILAVPQLQRIYKDVVGDDGPVKRVLGIILDGSSASLMSAIEALGTANSLTCSEFVYRCYAGADARLGIELNEPQVSWGSGEHREQGLGGNLEPGLGGNLEPGLGESDGLGAALGGESIGGGEWGFGDSGIVDGIDLVAFHDDDVDIEQGFGEAEMPGADADLGQALGVDASVVKVARTAFTALVAHNLRLDKYGDPQKPAVDPGTPIPDAVTPRDLWGSPSLVACSVLHRPPLQPDDSSGLDE